ncbi:uncharacterized protein LOC108678727 [Hyalella azteca]|uniref:Uncharacterized protein LOC108678727 n=1 Tax=Hyalella azteca TaxID=294128 RepID=A0A8B7P948_HYAAZ|nr:uncharacterized protein LOC108678727 [Hyalella azteca]
MDQQELPRLTGHRRQQISHKPTTNATKDNNDDDIGHVNTTSWGDQFRHYFLNGEIRPYLGTNSYLSDNKILRSWQYMMFMLAYCVACSLFGVLSVTLLPDPATLAALQAADSREGGADYEDELDDATNHLQSSFNKYLGDSQQYGSYEVVRHSNEYRDRGYPKTKDYNQVYYRREKRSAVSDGSRRSSHKRVRRVVATDYFTYSWWDRFVDLILRPTWGHQYLTYGVPPNESYFSYETDYDSYGRPVSSYSTLESSYERPESSYGTMNSSYGRPESYNSAGDIEQTSSYNATGSDGEAEAAVEESAEDLIPNYGYFENSLYALYLEFYNKHKQLLEEKYSSDSDEEYDDEEDGYEEEEEEEDVEDEEAKGNYTMRPYDASMMKNETSHYQMPPLRQVRYNTTRQHYRPSHQHYRPSSHNTQFHHQQLYHTTLRQPIQPTLTPLKGPPTREQYQTSSFQQPHMSTRQPYQPAAQQQHQHHRQPSLPPKQKSHRPQVISSYTTPTRELNQPSLPKENQNLSQQTQQVSQNKHESTQQKLYGESKLLPIRTGDNTNLLHVSSTSTHFEKINVASEESTNADANLRENIYRTPHKTHSAANELGRTQSSSQVYVSTQKPVNKKEMSGESSYLSYKPHEGP